MPCGQDNKEDNVNTSSSCTYNCTFEELKDAYNDLISKTKKLLET